MIEIDSKFSGRVIVCGLNENNVKMFVKKLIEYCWTDHDIPDDMRLIKSGKKLTLDMLPPNTDIDAFANRACDKGILMLERIGGVFLNLQLWVQKSNSQIKVDIDKFKYESSGNNLSYAVNKAIKDLT